jgi:hypothetical protein
MKTTPQLRSGQHALPSGGAAEAPAATLTGSEHHLMLGAEDTGRWRNGWTALRHVAPQAGVAGRCMGRAT